MLVVGHRDGLLLVVVSETDFLAVGAADRRRTALRADDGRRTAGLEKYRPDLSLVAAPPVPWRDAARSARRSLCRGSAPSSARPTPCDPVPPPAAVEAV